MSKKLVLAGGLALSLMGVVHAANYPNEVFYSIVNNSNVNLTGIPAHTTVPTSKLPFPPNKPYTYAISFGVDHTNITLCVGIGINNFSIPYVGAYALKTAECAVSVSTQKNSETDYTVIISDSK